MLPLQGSLPSSNLGVPTNASVAKRSTAVDSKSTELMLHRGSNPFWRAIFQDSLAG